MKQRVREIDFARTGSMLAVILLHTSSYYIFAESKLMICGMNLGFIINQTARFAVPVFVIISGLSLGLNKPSGIYFRFTAKRLSKVILPYLFWNIIYCVLNYHNNLREMLAPGFPAVFFRSILTGGFASHLYFIIVIIQLYLLYLPLEHLLKRFPAAVLMCSFLVTLSFQVIINLTTFDIYVLPVPIRYYAWFLFPTWLFFFTAGIFLRKHLEKMISFSIEYLHFLLPTAVLTAFLCCAEGKHFNTYELSVRPSLLIYAFLVLFAFFGIYNHLKRFYFTDKAVTFLSKYSFTTYFVHVWIIRFISNRFFMHGMSGLLLFALLVSIISVLFAVVFDSIIALFNKKLFTKKVKITK